MPTLTKTYSAAEMARFLRMAGFPVVRHTEGDEHVDGEVEVTDSVRVQIPTFGYSNPFVVRETKRDTYAFGEPRSKLSDLFADVRKAMKGGSR